MPLFSSNRSNKPSSHVTIVKAVNGGSAGHAKRQKQLSDNTNLRSHSRQQQQQQQGRRPRQKQNSHPNSSQQNKKKSRMDEFWGAMDEGEFVWQHPTTTPVRKDRLTSTLIMDQHTSSRRRHRQRESSSETQRTRQSSNQSTSRSYPEQEDVDFWTRPTFDEECETYEEEEGAVAPTRSIVIEEFVNLTPKKKTGFFQRRFFRF